MKKVQFEVVPIGHMFMWNEQEYKKIDDKFGERLDGHQVNMVGGHVYYKSIHTYIGNAATKISTTLFGDASLENSIGEVLAGTFITIFEDVCKKHQVENMRRVKNDAHNRNSALLKKIENMKEKYSLSQSINTILEWIEYGKLPEHEIIRAIFSKDTIKQTSSEKIFADFVSTKVGNLCKIVKSNDIYIDDGGNLKKLTKNKGAEKSKSLDFKITKNEKIIYTFNKVTIGSGGGQDNQYDDLRKFLERAVKIHVDNNIYWIGVADGSYYTDKKILQLKQDCSNSKNVFVMNTDELVKFIENL